MSDYYEKLKQTKLVMPMDLEKAVNHPASLHAKIFLPKPVTVLFVAWGERHVREALANACWFWALHRPYYGNMRVQVRLLDKPQVPISLIETCRARGIEVLTDLPPPPENKALYDLDRLRHATEIEGSVLYIDTDLYVMKPLDLRHLAGKPFMTFGMGGAMADREAMMTHKIVDEWFDAPSYVYWKDVGLTKEDYDSGSFWPWLRINLGMFWIDEGRDVLDFYAEFKTQNESLAYTRYFGLGEMIFSAMFNMDQIPGHVFEWRNGWNKIWPWIKDHDQQVGMHIEEGKVSWLYPRGRHDVIHMSHLGVQLHGKSDPMWRKVHMWCEDDGTPMIHLGMMLRQDDQAFFPPL